MPELRGPVKPQTAGQLSVAIQNATRALGGCVLKRGEKPPPPVEAKRRPVKPVPPKRQPPKRPPRGAQGKKE